MKVDTAATTTVLPQSGLAQDEEVRNASVSGLPAVIGPFNQSL